MFPHTPLRPPLAAMLAVAVVSCSSAFSPVAAQELKWQRGGQQSSAASISRHRSQAGIAAQSRFVEPSATRQASFEEPLRAATVSRAKRPSVKAVSARVARSESVQQADYRQSAPNGESLGTSVSGEIEFVSAVRDARAQAARHATEQVEQAGFIGAIRCGCGVAIEPGCAIPEPGCGIPAPACPVVPPTCGCVEPGCGCSGEVCEPSCGECVCGDVGCSGTCVSPSCPPSLGGCAERGAVPICIYLPPIKEVVLFGGVHGFKSPLDNTGVTRDAGNFGFHEGFNIGGRMSWLPWPGLGYQVGYQAVHSQLSGSSNNGVSDSHTQSFFTAGLFRRRFCGVQYGLVYDLLQDERQGSINFSQVRGLISTTNQWGHEVGFQFAAGTSEDDSTGTTLAATDQYLLFYRYHGRTGGEFRWLIGGNDEHHTILGADLQAPLNERWSIQTGFTYFIPSEGGAADEASEEGWNVGINLVWHYGCRGKQWYKSAWRPMFNVADNGSMFVDDRD